MVYLLFVTLNANMGGRVFSIDKHTNLQCSNLNYQRKMLYSSGPLTLYFISFKSHDISEVLLKNLLQQYHRLGYLEQ